MADQLLGTFVAGKRGNITINLYLGEIPRRTAAGPARAPYFVVTKDSGLVLDTRVDDDGGACVKEWPAACRPPGFAEHTHILRNRVPLTVDQARPIMAAETEARREYDGAIAQVGRQYQQHRKARVLADAGGVEGAADIEANYPGGYPAYERAELARGVRREPRFPGDAEGVA